MVAKKKVAKKAAAKKVVKKTVKVAKSEKAEPVEKVSHFGDYSLVVVESPSKAKTIKKYLGKGFQVAASNGHIKDLPKSKLGVDVEHNFEIDLVPITGKKDKIERLQELAKSAKAIYLAPDPDREGEAIAFHLAEEIGKKKKVYRVLFNAITKSAVTAAINNPTELDQSKYDAQRTRRVLDRLVGYKISPILWEKVQRGLSAGRVQSVALRIIVEREDEVRAFVSEQSFSIHAEFKKDGKVFDSRYIGDGGQDKGELKDFAHVEKIIASLKNKSFKISDIKLKERKQNPTPPFTTSKLQQEAANKLGFTTKKTMMVAQKLYEGIDLQSDGTQGLITYMRADSVRTEPEALNALREYIGKEYGADYLSQTPIIYKKKGNAKIQDAHESIRPTNLDYAPEKIKRDLSDDEFALYSLIWKKFISSQMSQAVIDQTSVTLVSEGHNFRANGSVIKFPGFRTIYLEAAMERSSKRKSEDEEEDHSEDKSSTELPLLKEGESLTPNKPCYSEEHWTSPPPRYSEASLVKELEEQGIGRPSTYAAIISNIQDRGYVQKTENRFHPTELGETVCRMLIISFPDIMDVTFTASVEETLDQIEDGSVKYVKFLKEFWKSFEKTLETAKEEMKNLKKQEIPSGVKCRKCGSGEYMVKWGRNGQFLACSNYPDCNSTEDFKKHLDGRYEIIEKTFATDPCPTCGKRLAVKSGKFGRFLACEEYPTCKTTLPYTLDVVCPLCKVGKFAEKKSRFGKIFYGCSHYPACSNAMWIKPVAHDCPSCGSSVMGERITKKAGLHYECPKCKHKVFLEDKEE